MAAPTLSNPWQWPLAALFILPLLYLFFFRSSSYGQGARRKRDTPGPPKQLPVLGNLLQLGRVRMVVVSSPEAAKEALRTNDLHCCSRPNSPGARMLSYNFLDVAFGPYSDYWREMRKLLVLELLSARRVQSFAYARAAEVDRLVESLAAAPPGTPVDLSEKLYALSDGIIGTVAFGKMYGSASFERSNFQRMMDETLQVLGSFTFEDFFPSSALARWADVLTHYVTSSNRRHSKVPPIDSKLPPNIF